MADFKICPYCQYEPILKFDEDSERIIEEECPACLGSKQVPCDADGRTDYKRLFQARISPSEFARQYGRRLEDQNNVKKTT